VHISFEDFNTGQEGGQLTGLAFTLVG